MIREKIFKQSEVLKRGFHADLFHLECGGVGARVAVVFFGGSGVTREQYEARGRTVTDAFDAALGAIEFEHSVKFAFVTAPYDIPFGRFDVEQDQAARWLTHVSCELLPTLLAQLDPLPVYLAGYSGGAALALNGVHEIDTVIGAAFLGADALPHHLETPAHWARPVSLYYNEADTVFRANVAAIEHLDGAVRCFRGAPGGHALCDYVSNGLFRSLILGATTRHAV